MNDLIQFEDKTIRKIWHDEQWYFAITDIIEVLTNSPQPSSYWNKVKNDILKESESLPFWQRLNLPRKGGRNYPSDCANTEGIFRIIMSIPSPKAEPFRLWLAEQGRRTIDEINDPELAIDRAKEYYKLKGYSDEWIATRLKSIDIRKELTDEWQKRGVTDSKDYSILTSVISKETFGLSPSEHAQLKGLTKENLRDHMTNLELIFSMLGEETTRMIADKDNAQGFKENHDAAVEGGKLTGQHREQLEKRTGQKVISNENFKHLKNNQDNKLEEEPSIKSEKKRT